MTELQELEARRQAQQEAKANKVAKEYTEDEKNQRKERVAKAKDDCRS